VTGSFWWDLLIGVAAALLLAWLAMVFVLVIARPRGGLLGETLQVLPRPGWADHRPPTRRLLQDVTATAALRN
jgi:hypothetical protein